MSDRFPHSVYLIGIGGIGMSGLARYYNSQGCAVAGYDRTRTPLTDELIEEGIHVHFEDDVDTIPTAIVQDTDVLVIRTPAIPPTSAILNFWTDKEGVQVLKRAEVLGRIAMRHTTFAVAGTHGKTTVSSMLAHILHTSGHGINAFLGGIAVNYNSNVIVDPAATSCVVEADEFDRSFLYLQPEHAVITSVDADHLDIYESSTGIIDGYRSFADQVKKTLILKKGVAERLGREAMEYALEGPADVYTEALRIEEGKYHFDIVHPKGRISGVNLGMAGKHNVENAVAACCLALQAGASVDAIRHGLATFEGIERRFNVLINTNNRVLVDDYAHHPTELTAAILSAKEMFPGRNVTVVFQPHLFSRTKDFATGFAASLSLADQLVLLDIYPAREEPIPGVTSEWLSKMVDVDPCLVCRKDELKNVISNLHADVLLLLGAGDIGQEVGEIKKMLEQQLA